MTLYNDSTTHVHEEDGCHIMQPLCPQPESFVLFPSWYFPGAEWD